MSESFGPVEEADLSAVARITAHAFAGTPEGSLEWLKLAGTANLRGLRDAGEVQASLVRVPMGVYLGGRSVPMIGIAGVGVAPESRGRGLAGRLMAETIAEIGREGVALSGLYPATQPLYRRVGYEQAGHRFEIRLPLAAIDVPPERTLTIRPLTPEHAPAVRACYAEFARRFDGPLDRAEYIWARIPVVRDTTYAGFAAFDAVGELHGYLYVNQRRKPERLRQELTLSDLAFRTDAGARRLLGFLADFSSLGEDVVFFGGPTHPILAFLSEQKAVVTGFLNWMLRITCLPAAIEARGYRGVRAAEVHLDITDPLIPDNAGRWVVTVESGAGRATRGGRGDLRLDVGALAPLYSGYCSARQLALQGRASGPDAALDDATAIFSGTTPWLADMY
ncbi:MAG: GNAT family N-acetyltransferase [Phycisphaerae bacterium]|nr:GNAT family N-acetyltransferase [Phycisphaerae bacterium]